MVKLPPVRTPWAQRARRVRYQLVPVLAFGVAIVLTTRLWPRHISTVGEVEVVRFEMAAPVAGILDRLPGRSPQLFDRIQRNAVVARLDEKPAKAALAIVQQDIGRLNAELAATRARVQQELVSAAMDHADQERQRRAEIRRLAVDVEQLRLDVLDRKALIETDSIEWQRHDEQYKATKEAFEKGVETSYTLSNIELRRDVIAQRIKSNQRSLAEAEKQSLEVLARRKAAQARLQDDTKTPQPADLQTFLAPVAAAISVQEARMRELGIQIQSLTIRSPTGGTICEIYRRPGQPVQAGEPILAIAVDGRDYVISYVREGQYQSVRPTEGMKVTVRIRGKPRRTVDGHVERVGPQVAEVPPHHLRDRKVPEWGLPVRIAAPGVSILPPGELVDVRFRATP